MVPDVKGKKAAKGVKVDKKAKKRPQPQKKQKKAPEAEEPTGIEDILTFPELNLDPRLQVSRSCCCIYRCLERHWYIWLQRNNTHSRTGYSPLIGWCFFYEWPPPLSLSFFFK